MSIALYGGKILAHSECNANGRNSNYETRKYKTHSGKHLSCSVHSEAVLLHKINKKITYEKKRKMNKLIVINIRISKDGKISQSCCCIECAKLLNKMGVTKVYYTDEHGNFVKDKIKNIMSYAKKSSGAGRYIAA